MSQKGEKYARRMERRVDKLEQDVAATIEELAAEMEARTHGEPGL